MADNGPQGAKKQKLDKTKVNGVRHHHHQKGHATPMNGHSSGTNGYSHLKVVSPEMGFYCFDALVRHLNRKDAPTKPSFSNDRYPLFVTWKTGKDRRLRGCIGTFTPLALHDGLHEYAITSAVRDSRFRPINNDEVHKLTVCVSVLLTFEDAKDHLDWEIGIHGIRIEFLSERGDRKSATYLPEVAPEQGWSKEETIDSLLRKGNHRGPITPEFRSSIKLTRYQSERIFVTFDDYLIHRNNR